MSTVEVERQSSTPGTEMLQERVIELLPLFVQIRTKLLHRESNKGAPNLNLVFSQQPTYLVPYFSFLLLLCERMLRQQIRPPPRVFHQRPVL